MRSRVVELKWVDKCELENDEYTLMDWKEATVLPDAVERGQGEGRLLECALTAVSASVFVTLINVF